jgi:CopG family transcriptional regulator, nickel-responsive regulator
VPRKKPPPPAAPAAPPPPGASDLVRFGVAIERPLLDAFDDHLARRGYENRSEALRDLVRAELTRDAWDRGEQAIATISIIYDHHVRELTERLIEIQHEHGERVISATHVHLDHDHCLEVVLAKGPAKQLKRLADRLIGAKGVISGEVSGMAIVGRPHDHDHDHEAPKRSARARKRA